MIRIEKLTKHDIGRWVFYIGRHKPKQAGRIKSWNDHWVFVVYHCDEQWDCFENYTAAATDPKELKFMYH